MVKSEFKIEKFLHLYLKTIFYAALIASIFAYYGHYQIPSFSHCLFLPMNSADYWFISNYLFLYLLSPFINIFIRNANEKMHLSLIVLLFVFWSVLFPLNNIPFSFSELGWFIFLYITGAYIRLYPKKIYDNNIFNFLSLFAMCLLSILILIGYNHSHFAPMWDAIKYMSDYSFIIVIISLNIFFLFKNIKIQSSLVNWASQSVLGIYLIHDNNFVRPFIWVGLVHAVRFMDSMYFIPLAILISLCVFSICLILDKILNFVLEMILKIIKIEKLSFINKYINSNTEKSLT